MSAAGGKPADDQEAAAVGVGLRIGAAAIICLVASAWFRLEQAALSVYSAHMAMVLFPHTAFQKGVERVLGRVLGILYGLAAVTFFLQVPPAFVALVVLGLVAFYYVYASGRLSYAALNGGLFVGILAGFGVTAPEAAAPFAAHAIPQTVLGFLAGTTVNWVSGAERSVALAAPGEPLWPPRRDWLLSALRIAVMQLAALAATWLFALPLLTTMISAAIVGTVREPHARRRKGLERALGALLGGGYAAVAMVLLALLPYFGLLLALVSYGMFLAAYHTRTSQRFSYSFQQMGLVIPLVLIAEHGGLGTLGTDFARLVGVAVGLAAAEAVAWLWP